MTIHFPLECFSMSLPVVRIAENRVRLEAVPFMSEVANFRDIVEVATRADGEIEFVCVADPGHWRVHEFCLSRDDTESNGLCMLWARVEAAGCYMEQIFGGVLFICVPPAVSFDAETEIKRAFHLATR